MTESEWLACTNPWRILEFLPSESRNRKRRRFPCAGCRFIWRQSGNGSRKAVETSERIAYGSANLEELQWLDTVSRGVLGIARPGRLEPALRDRFGEGIRKGDNARLTYICQSMRIQSFNQVTSC